MKRNNSIILLLVDSVSQYGIVMTAKKVWQFWGEVTQLVEWYLEALQVIGSIPILSTKFLLCHTPFEVLLSPSEL